MISMIEVKEELHTLFDEFIFNRDEVDKDRLIVLSKNYIDLLEIQLASLMEIRK